MKYHTLSSFDKHLKEAFPEHLSPTYLIVTPCSFERHHIAKTIFSLIAKKEEASFHKCEASTTSLPTLLADLNTFSFVGGRAVTFFDQLQEVKQITSLTHYVCCPNPTLFLILGSSSMKPLADLYQKGKKEIVVLDLSEEKPWDKERRVVHSLIAEASLNKKHLSSEAASFLLEKVGSDMATLFQELEKLLCFTADRPSITLSDVTTISSSHPQINSWQLAENVIWHKEGTFPQAQLSDLSFFLPFIGQLRYHLQLGYKISSLLVTQISSAEIAKILPHVRPATLEKYLFLAQQRTSCYFHQGLLSLYDMELAAKSTPLNLASLFAHFLGKLYK